jgi:hypothetical protein
LMTVMDRNLHRIVFQTKQYLNTWEAMFEATKGVNSSHKLKGSTAAINQRGQQQPYILIIFLDKKSSIRNTIWLLFNFIVHTCISIRWILDTIQD